MVALIVSWVQLKFLQSLLLTTVPELVALIFAEPLEDDLRARNFSSSSLTFSLNLFKLRICNLCNFALSVVAPSGGGISYSSSSSDSLALESESSFAEF